MRYNDDNAEERKAFTRKLGLKIAKLRGEQGLSKDELSFIAQMHPQLIYDIEVAKKNASIYLVAKLARGLNVTLSELLEDINL